MKKLRTKTLFKPHTIFIFFYKKEDIDLILNSIDWVYSSFFSFRRAGIYKINEGAYGILRIDKHLIAEKRPRPVELLVKGPTKYNKTEAYVNLYWSNKYHKLLNVLKEILPLQTFSRILMELEQYESF